MCENEGKPGIEEKRMPMIAAEKDSRADGDGPFLHTRNRQICEH